MLALVAAQGDPAGLDDPGGLRALVGWAAQRLGAPHLTGPTLAAMPFHSKPRDNGVPLATHPRNRGFDPIFLEFKI